MDTRAQLQNKKLCLERLESITRKKETEQQTGEQKMKWLNHAELNRGNPVKTIIKNYSLIDHSRVVIWQLYLLVLRKGF